MFKLRLKAELASLISLKIIALFEKIVFTSPIVLTVEELAEFASNRLMPATILFKSACKSIIATAGEMIIGVNENRTIIEINFRFIK